MKKKSQLIYLADDDPDDRMLFQEALAEVDADIRYEAFDNGVSLMESLLDREKAFPRAVFLDLNMPLMNGEECLADIRNEPLLANIPVIIYSTYVDNMKISLLREKGANLYLVKPTSFKELVSALNKSFDYLEAGAYKVVEEVDFMI